MFFAVPPKPREHRAHPRRSRGAVLALAQSGPPCGPWSGQGPRERREWGLTPRRQVGPRATVPSQRESCLRSPPGTLGGPGQASRTAARER